MTAFALRLDEMERLVGGTESALELAITRVTAIQDTLLRSTVDARFITQADDMAKRLKIMLERLDGDDRRGRMNEGGPVPIDRRVAVAFYGTHFSTYGPTPTHLQSLAIAEQQFAELKAEFEQLLETELPAFEATLNAAGVPWTPGRGIPD